MTTLPTLNTYAAIPLSTLQSLHIATDLLMVLQPTATG
jgi:hypothetical protein